jgi:hypothetical protein
MSRKFTQFRRVVTAGSFAAATVTTALLIGAGPVSAATPPASPSWITGTVQTDRGSGSDTTFFLMQKISDLYNQAALYGCALSADDFNCLDDTAPYDSSHNPDNPATTDYTDNYDRTEEVQGVDEVGSGAGQAQLCGANQGTNNAALPPWAAIDYARSSSGISTKQTSSCLAVEKEDFFAADAVDLLDWTNINPSTFGTATAAPYASVNGGHIGNVAAGWLPGDPLTCASTTTGSFGAHQNGFNDCSGYPFGDVDNTTESLSSGGDGGGTGANSVAFEIWCSGSITDWGQLTNVGPFTSGVPSKAVGTGTSINIPINLIGVNPSSGTNGVWTTFVQSAQPACNSNGHETVVGSDTHLALENNTAQLDDFATTDYPGDLPDQAAELATALYYVANGVNNSSPYQSSVALTVGGVKNAATLKSFPGQLVGLNNMFPAPGNILNNTFPTARELGNIYRTDTLRASTAGFLNWICDDNNVFAKGKDLSNGKNYDAEISGLINTSFGFIRLDDSSSAPNGNACPMITSVHDAAS